MLDLDDLEREALSRTLSSIAEIMTEFGWHRALNSLSEREVLVLSEAIIEAFQDALVDLKSRSNPPNEEIPF
jgi:hypothetical protein